jgi:regulator of cell morphogenesis and NO signaling
MKIDPSQRIAKIACELPGAMTVFEQLDLDYFCAGDRSLNDAAHAAGLDPNAVVASLRQLDSVKNAVCWNERPLSHLVRYLVQQHHRFVREELRSTAILLADLTSSAETTADLNNLRTMFTRLSDIVLPHHREEEQQVFRDIEKLEKAWEGKEIPEAVRDGMKDRVRQMVSDHGAIAAHLRAMRVLRTKISMSDPAHRTQQVLASIAHLEAHLHEYMYLENCILFPRAVAMEEQLAGAHH